MPKPTQHLLALAIAFGLAANSPVLADLQPQEIAVLANSSFPGSVALAEYYCRQRGVPPENVISLDMPQAEPIGRAKYEQIAKRLRQTFNELPNSESIRCVLTVRGVPLRVSPSSPTVEEKETSDMLKQGMAANLQQLNGIRTKVRPLAGLPAVPATSRTANTSLQKRWVQLRVEVTRELNQAWREAGKMTDTKRRQRAGEELLQLEQELLGLRVKLNRFQKSVQAGVGNLRNQELVRLEEQLDEADRHMFRLLRPSATAEDISQAGQIARLSRGLVGLIDQQNLLIGLINTKHEETQSGFDSELSLLLAGEYPLKGPARILCV